MGAVFIVGAAEARHRRVAQVVLALVVAVAGGIVIALAVGSLRSSSVVGRYFAQTIRYDTLVFAPEVAAEEIGSLPGVTRADPEAYLAMEATRPDGTPTNVNGLATEWSSVDGGFRILEGRRPNGSDPLEAIVNLDAAEMLGVEVGDDLAVRMYAPEQGETLGQSLEPAAGPVYTLRVAAIFDSPDSMARIDVEGSTLMGNYSQLVVPYAFYADPPQPFLRFGEEIEVELEDHEGLETFGEQLSRLAGEAEVVVEPEAARFQPRRADLEPAVRLETGLLWSLALVTALAFVVGVALLVRAEQRLHVDQHEVLHALGLTRSQLGLVAVRRTLVAAVSGALLAVLVAVSLSSRFPVGVGRRLEPAPGRDLNVAALVAGGAGAALLVAAVAFAAGRAGPGRVDPARPRGRGLWWSGFAWASPVAVLGAHLAFGRSSRSRRGAAWPPVLVGAVAATAVVGAGVYVAGIEHLVSNGPAHGFGWDVVVGNVNFPFDEGIRAQVADDPAVASVSDVVVGEAQIDGRQTEVVGYDGTEPALAPPLVSGRPPRTAREIALGDVVLRALGVEVGDTITFSLAGASLAEGGEPSPPVELLVVGRGPLPIFGEAGLADGAVVTVGALREAGATIDAQMLAVRFQPGVDRTATVRGFEQRYPNQVIADVVPAKIVSLRKVVALPLLGAGVVAGLGALTVAYALLTSTRLRRGELAVVRALGMTPRAVGGSIVVQGALVSLAILVVGLPVGLLAGSTVWHVVADRLGVGPGAQIPWVVSLVVPVTLMVVVGAALVPARLAARPGLARLLRTD